jgi:hypothetical protein
MKILGKKPSNPVIWILGIILPHRNTGIKGFVLQWGF